MSKIIVGTSGWSYNHWKQKVYPDKMPANKWLQYYSNFFDVVEINSTFYRTATDKTIKNWVNNTPENFKFVFKLSRLITHTNLDIHKTCKVFYDSIKMARAKTVAVLAQFPASFDLTEKNCERLERLLKENNKRNYRIAIEFRNSSWQNDQTSMLLSKYGAACVFADSQRNEVPFVFFDVADFFYLRLHGSKLYNSNYTDKELKKWAQKIKKNSASKNMFLIFFNNDRNGYAFFNALKLKKLL